MPLLSVIILFQLPIFHNFKFPPSYFNAIYICVSFNLIVIPLSMAFYLKKQGIIQSLKMHQVEERVYPYAITSIFYLLTYLLFSQINFPPPYLAVFLATSASVFILYLLALAKKKISAHMCGIGGICGLLLVLNQWFGINTIPLLIPGILAAGFLAAARLYLEAHKLSEITLGFALGFVCQLSLLLY